MKRGARRSLIALAIGGTIAVITAGVLYVDDPAGYRGPDLLDPPARAAAAAGPLRVRSGDPRYFGDATGRPVYLTGSHTWNVLQDFGYTDPPPAFDFDEYLRFLLRHRHNFIRLWRGESPRVTVTDPHRILSVAPHPWQRVGPGLAADGKPRFDLTKFDVSYFDRLEERVRAAGERGIYVSVMLFEGWGMRFSLDGYDAHPFRETNNVNGIECDLNRDGKGLECFTLADPSVTRLQEAYVRQVVDTLNDLDNVLYEISNENHWESFEWELHFLDYVRGYEKGKPKQHPIGLTSNGGGGRDDTGRLFGSSADWISPNSLGRDYRENPPTVDGDKVIISDTDHLWGLGGTTAWVWKSFLRGLNPIFMDPYQGHVLAVDNDAQRRQWEQVRRAMGHTAWFAGRLDLDAAVPRPELASTGYALANPGVEYLVFLPLQAHWRESSPRLFRLLERPISHVLARSARNVVVDLAGGPGEYVVEWFDASSGATYPGQPVSGGRAQSFTAPFAGDAVLYLKRMS